MEGEKKMRTITHDWDVITLCRIFPPAAVGNSEPERRVVPTMFLRVIISCGIGSDARLCGDVQKLLARIVAGWLARKVNAVQHCCGVVRSTSARGRSKEVKESHAMLGSKVTALCEVLLLDEHKKKKLYTLSYGYSAQKTLKDKAVRTGVLWYVVKTPDI
eukprot:g44742.t1